MKIDLNLVYDLVSSAQLCIEKHETEDIYIVGYENGTMDKPAVWNSLTRMCRGLIVDGSGNILQRPFEKFWTFRQNLSENSVLLSENRIQKLPELPFRIFEKLDGSMATLYWIKDVPKMATQRSFASPKAKRATEILHSKYYSLFEKIDRDKTYVFEAIYPETAIIVEYGLQDDLILIAVIDNKTGISVELPNIGFKTCRDLTETYGHITDLEKLAEVDLKNAEGFVIQYENDLRIKIKFPSYKAVAQMKDKIIMHSKMLAMNQILLMKKIGMPGSSLSNIDVYNSLKSGDRALAEIRLKLTAIHYNAGVEFWLQEKVNEIMSTQSKAEGADCWEDRKPDAIEYFELDTTFENEKNLDVTMWNWKERFLKIYN